MSTASDQITEYLSVGGLFNPETMNRTQHEAVRDTLIKARDDIQQLERENAALRAELEFWRDGSIVREEDHNERKALRELLREARDTVRASTVEDGISGLRREYRSGLYQRIQDTLKKEAQS